MPSPLTEEDLVALTNKFEKWKDYLNDNNNSSPQDYPSFSPFFNCISSIRETFFQYTLANLPSQNTNYQNNSSNNNNNNNFHYDNENHSMKNEKRKSSSTTKTTAEMEKRRRADLVAIPKENPHRGEGDGEGEGRSKTITDIPNDVLATILEYVLPYYNPIQRFVELTLVSKVWHRMVHAVSRIHNSSIINYYYYFKTTQS